jgi:hypothetical protein
MPAPALRDVQAAFWRSLHTGDVEPALTRVVLPTPVLDPGERVAVYQGMYVGRLRDVLREDHPKLAEALGAEFDGVARRYLSAHPSSHPSIRHFGRHLHAFLETDATARERPWLADLARLERARVDAFDAPDAEALKSADLAVVAPEDWADLRFTPVPSLCLVESAWTVHDVWSAPTERPVAGPVSLRVWRQEFKVFHAAMDPLEADALRALVAGAPFADVCDAVVRHVDVEEAPAEAGALLARWIEDGLVAALAR